MNRLGFSTGALARGDFRTALRILAPYSLTCLELSALRFGEVRPLLDSIETLELARYSYISFHAPSRFTENEEEELAHLLFEKVPSGWPIIMHPDAIYDFSNWAVFGRRLAIENMDRRKHTGRSVAELTSVFRRLPDASFCFDLGHARQYDASMTEAFLMLAIFRDKLAQLHISEVDTESQHNFISYGARIAFRQVAGLIPSGIPVIIESKVTESELAKELVHAHDAITTRASDAPAIIHSLLNGLQPA